PQGRDLALAVSAFTDEIVEALDGLHHDLDALVLLRLQGVVRQLSRQVGMDLLVGEARARVEAGQMLPTGRGLADLLAELAPGGLEDVGAVELSGGELEEALLADRLPGLAHEPDPLTVEGEHHRRARMLHDLAPDDLAR